MFSLKAVWDNNNTDILVYVRHCGKYCTDYLI